MREPGPYRSEMRDVVVIAPPPHEAAAREAIAAIGARMVDAIGWDAVAARLGLHIRCDALLVETEGVGDDLLAAMLPRIDTFARANDTPVIVALGADQIDAVAVHLLGPGIDLLCPATPAARVAALATAASSRAGLVMEDPAPRAESERLRRLNDEVARIAETLVQLTRPSATRAAELRPGAVADAGRAFAPPPMAGDPEVRAGEVRLVIRARRLRDSFFPGGLFEDPAWDMLLDLFAADLERAQVSVSSLCIAAAVAPTTALRWIGRMVETGLFVRRPDPHDRRRAFLALSSTAREGMAGYFAAARRQGLATG